MPKKNKKKCFFSFCIVDKKGVEAGEVMLKCMTCQLRGHTCDKCIDQEKAAQLKLMLELCGTKTDLGYNTKLYHNSFESAKADALILNDDDFSIFSSC